MRLLLIASDRRELAPLAARCASRGRLDWPVDWCRRGKFGDLEILMAANGVGGRHAARAVETAPAADAVCSVGFCGALDPVLEPGDIFIGLSVQSAAETYPALPVSSGRARASGVVWSSDHVVQTSAEKAALRARGAAVVEMEAAGVARAARERGLPFYCIKTVTDLAVETLATDFNSALRPDGHFDTMSILRASFSRPAAGIPELIRLYRRCALAARRLGVFFADCRF